MSTKHLHASPRMRSDLCGRLDASDVGRFVAVCGWIDKRRAHSEHLVFIDLRDHSGVLQCVIDGDCDLRSEYVVRIAGTVRLRPEGTYNTALSTGEVELQDCEIELLSHAKPSPFPLDERTEVNETLRLRHRYLDLRKPRMQHNLRTRASINRAIRRSMDAQGFVEIETPLLVASTPEGARDFVVPARKEPGSFYALPQSPQIFKQLTMIGGLDRYYQIARCLRDEDLRADRQFEFSQLDIEASFVTRDEILEIVTNAVTEATIEAADHDPGSFDRMRWHDAMERFGSDKPDTRFGMELVELTPIFTDTEARVFQAPCVKGICLRGGADTLSRNRVDELVTLCQGWGAKGLAWMRVSHSHDDTAAGLEGGVAKFLSSKESADVIRALDARPNDMVFLVADERTVVRQVLGLLRLELGRQEITDNSSFNYLWVVDFPLFEGIAVDGTPIPSHHPFTMPHEEDLHKLMDIDTTPAPESLLEIRSQSYDLVLNGWELGSGSTRIHNSEIQQRIFEVLRITHDEVQDRFGFFLDALQYGAPPHAGFAVGLDRLTALLLREDNIREVIAFPKTQSGADPLTGAPSAMTAAHLRELGLQVIS